MPTTILGSGGSGAPSIYIPTDANVYSKIVITDDSDVDYTILDTYGGALSDNYLMSNASITRGATDRLGQFNFSISNIDGTFLNKFNGGEVIKFYADVTDATTEIFRGKIDNVKYGLSLQGGFVVNIDGRDYPEVVDRTITGIEASISSDISLAGIFYTYFNNVTLTFWNGTQWAEATYVPAGVSEASVNWDVSVPTYPSTLINTSYQHTKAWSVITDFCGRVGLECYFYHDGSKWTLRTFIEESITNTGSNIAYGVNLINVGEFGKENTDVLNRVIVYGKTEGDNILTVKTENDTESQSNLWIKDTIISDGSLTTLGMVNDKADFELSKGINNPSLGNITAVCLPTLNPGELINVSIPYCNIDGSYRVAAMTHTLGNFSTTKVELSAKLKTAGELFITKLNPDEVTSGIDNPNDMNDSFTVFFDESPSYISSYSSSAVEDGVLKLDNGDITGNVISSTLTTDKQITSVEFRRYENYSTGDDTYYVSNTGGVLWDLYVADSGETQSFSVAGNELKFKILMSRTSSTAPSPAYESVCLLYK